MTDSSESLFLHLWDGTRGRNSTESSVYINGLASVTFWQCVILYSDLKPNSKSYSSSYLSEEGQQTKMLTYCRESTTLWNYLLSDEEPVICHILPCYSTVYKVLLIVREKKRHTRLQHCCVTCHASFDCGMMASYLKSHSGVALRPCCTVQCRCKNKG